MDGAPGKLGAFFVSRARVRAPGGPGNRNGVREQGSGNRGQGTGLGEQGSGNRERGTGNRERGTGNGERGSGNGDQGSTRRGMGQWDGCSVGCKGTKVPKK